MSGGRNKFLVILVVVLVLTNLGMLWYFTSNGKSSKEEKLSKNDRQVAFMVKELSLDSTQKAAYIALRAKRDSALNPLNEDLREAKLKLMSLLKEGNVSDSLMTAATTEIAAKQQPIEMEFYKHFQRVRALCNPQQEAKYDSMLVRFVNKSTGKDDNKKYSVRFKFMWIPSVVEGIFLCITF
jgi:protein CpxP